jgi:hypothetical protein
MTLIDLHAPPDLRGEFRPRAINDFGDIAGFYWTDIPGVDLKGFLFLRGSFVKVDNFPDVLIPSLNNEKQFVENHYGGSWFGVAVH